MMFVALAVVVIICAIVRGVRHNRPIRFKDDVKVVEETEHTLYIENNN